MDDLRGRVATTLLELQEAAFRRPRSTRCSSCNVSCRRSQSVAQSSDSGCESPLWDDPALGVKRTGQKIRTVLQNKLRRELRGLWLKRRKKWSLHFKHVYLSKLKSTLGVDRITDSKQKPMHAFPSSSSLFTFRAAIHIVLVLCREGVMVGVCVCWGVGGVPPSTRANLVFSASRECNEGNYSHQQLVK